MSSQNNLRILICTGGSWMVDNGAMEYVPVDVLKVLLYLKFGLTRVELIEVVCKRLKISDISDVVRLSYKFPFSSQVIDLVDDYDVSLFVDVVSQNTAGEMVTLYVVQRSTGSNRRSGTGSNQQSNVNPTFMHDEHTQVNLQVAHFPETSGMHDYNHDPAYVNFKTCLVGPSKQQHNSFKLDGLDDDSNDGLVLVNDEKLSPCGKFFENELLHPETANMLGVNDDDFENSEAHENDDVRVDCATNDVGNVDFFWGMPLPLPTPAPTITPTVPVCYERSKHVALLQVFNTKEELKLALGLKCIEEGFEYKTNRSSKSRFEVVCIHESCEWSCKAVSISGTTMFQVRKLNEQHTCSKTQMHPNHRQANKKVLGHILKEVMESTSRVYRGKEIEADMRARFKIQISYAQAWRAKCYALQLLRGSPEESFTRLPIYCHNLKKSNPGTVTEIQTDEFGRFELLFVAIGCAVRTFCNHLRPLIIIDGAHLKGRYLGTMFLAVAMDGNNQILPIAYGVGKTESGDSWTWFLSKLKECIGEMENLVIISDRANSIDLAIRRVFENAFHGICCRHLCMNLRVRSKKSNEIEWLFWKAVKSYQVTEFENYMNGIRSVNPRVAVKLQEAGYEKWSRAYCPAMRYNVMTSNSAESVNALSRYARKLPIIMLIDFFRSTLQQWYFNRRHTAC